MMCRVAGLTIVALIWAQLPAFAQTVLEDQPPVCAADDIACRIINTPIVGGGGGGGVKNSLNPSKELTRLPDDPGGKVIPLEEMRAPQFDIQTFERQNVQ